MVNAQDLHLSRILFYSQSSNNHFTTERQKTKAKSTVNYRFNSILL